MTGSPVLQIEKEDSAGVRAVEKERIFINLKS